MSDPGLLEASAVNPAPQPVDPAPLETRRNRNEALLNIGLYLLCIGVAIGASAILIAITGGPWRDVLNSLLDGSVRKPGRGGDTLAEAAPLLVVALGAIISSRAGLVNIGQEGQLLFGAACMAMVATRGSGPFVLILALAAGIVGGAFWSGLAALLKYWRKVPEVITTLLLVFIASQLTGYMLTRQSLLLDSDPNRPNRTQTSGQLSAETRLPSIRIFGNEFPVSVVIALALALLVAFVMARTVWGFKLRMVGQNASTAQRAGVSAVAAGSIALAIGGGLAGLSGGMMLAGGVANYRYTPGFANSVGWEGLLVALVARNRPLVAIPVAIVFGALRTGSGFLASTGVEREIVDIVRSLLVLALLIPPAVSFIRTRRRALRAAAVKGA